MKLNDSFCLFVITIEANVFDRNQIKCTKMSKWNEVFLKKSTSKEKRAVVRISAKSILMMCILETLLVHLLHSKIYEILHASSECYVMFGCSPHQMLHEHYLKFDLSISYLLISPDSWAQSYMSCLIMINRAHCINSKWFQLYIEHLNIFPRFFFVWL